ncbi:MAG: hypothetical protein H6593_04700 [Flavobacteriales bacterium]|nr:hypothetical protein [Flavobacteriales bacterium]
MSAWSRSVWALPILIACGGGTDDGPSASEPASPAAERVVDLSPWDVPLEVNAPGTLADSLQVEWNEEFGQLEVRGGEHFSLVVVEAPGDIARLKADLERDLLRTHEVLAEEPGLLIYRSAFPDDPDLVFVHGYRELRVGDRSFVVETHPQGHFNEAEVEVMVRSVVPREGA